MSYIDIAIGRVAAQTQQVVASLGTILDANGLGLDRLLHLRVLISDPNDEVAVSATLVRALAPHLPSISIVVVAPEALDPKIALQIDAVAAAADRAVPVIHRAETRSHGWTAPFAASSRFGDYVFTSMLTPVNADGAPVELEADLDSAAAELAASTVFQPSPGLQIFLRQQAAGFAELSAIVRAAGADQDRIVYLGEFYAGVTMAGLIAGCSTGVATLAGPHCLTSFTQQRLRHPAARYAGRAIAYAGSPGTASDSSLSPVFAEAVRAGEVLFVSGEVPIDAEAARPLASASDMDGVLQLTDLGRWVGPQPALAQARLVYRKLAATLTRYGCTLAEVAQQTVYLIDPRDAPLVELAAMSVFGGRLPPTVVVPIAACSPSPLSRVEIEFVAHCGAEGES